MISAGLLPKSLLKCYRNRTDQSFLNMLRIFVERGSERMDGVRIDRQRIVPVEWYRRNSLELDCGNTVFLSPKDCLRTNVLQYHYFLRNGDSDMARRVLRRMKYLDPSVPGEIRSFGDVCANTYERYSERRRLEFTSRGA